MQYVYVVVALVAVLVAVSVALAFTSMQLQSLVSEAESFKAKVIEINSRLKQENEQLKYQVEGLMARMQPGSFPSTSPTPNTQEVPMVTIVKGKISGVAMQKNLVIRSNDEFVKIWEEIYSGRPGEPPLPQIDFTTATVLAAFNGERPDSCHDILIKKVEVPSGEHLETPEKVATVIRIEPAADAVCDLVPSQAYHIVAIPFSLDEITFDVWVENVNN